MNKLPYLLLILIVSACNKTYRINNEAIECRFCWGIDDSLDIEQSNNIYCAPTRQITMCFSLINKGDSSAFVPMYTLMDSTFKSHIIVYAGDKEVNSICKFRKTDKNFIIAVDDSIQIEIVLLEKHLIDAGIKDMPIEVLTSKIHFEYVIDSSDITSTKKSIRGIIFGKISHKLFISND